MSNLTKSIYSCKNVLYKGRRKYLLASMFKVDQAKHTQSISEKTDRLTSFEVFNFRAIIFDSKKFEDSVASIPKNEIK